MAKTSPIGLRLDPDLKDELDRAARADKRSTSSLIHKILSDWAEQRSSSAGTTSDYEGA